MKKLYIIALLLFVPAILFALYKFNPSAYSFFPKCPFHYLTGFDCPVCGSQRAVHALLHGKIAEAADLNFLLVLSIPLLLIQFGYDISGRIAGTPRSWSVIRHPLTPKIIWILVIAFWVLRNIPAAPFLYLAA